MKKLQQKSWENARKNERKRPVGGESGDGPWVLPHSAVAENVVHARILRRFGGQRYI